MKTFYPQLPGDKSISHRALLMASLADGESTLHGLSTGQDVISTAECLKKLNVSVYRNDTIVKVKSPSLWISPGAELDCGNSGTTARHLLAVLAGLNIQAKVIGDESLTNRPMSRVTDPLEKSGACFDEKKHLPISVLSGINSVLEHKLEIASGQVKSALIFAGLSSGYGSRLSGALSGRDHTERMLRAFGVKIHQTSYGIELLPNQKAQAAEVIVPKDPSAAAFWVTWAILGKNKEVVFENLLLNPGRIGFFQALKKMNANIEWEITENHMEPIGNLRARSSSLNSITLDNIVDMIDEVPLLALCASQAEGVTKVSNATELRKKESDRIQSVKMFFQALSMEFIESHDGFTIKGPQRPKSGRVQVFNDHRIAMLGLLAEDLYGASVNQPEWVSVSDPYFLQNLKELRTC